MSDLTRMEQKEEEQLIEVLEKKTNFSMEEISGLMEIYREQTGGKEQRDKVKYPYMYLYLSMVRSTIGMINALP